MATKPKRDEQATPYNAETSERGPSDNGLAKYKKDFERATKYVQTNYHSKWFDFWRIYNNQRVKIGYNSIADAFVPETRTIVESLVANIAGAQPKFEYVPTNEEQERDTKVLSELIAYYWDANHMGTKSQSWVRDAILYGTGVLHVSWDAERNMPRIDNVPLRDFFVDPSATSLEDARYVGFRYLANKDDLDEAEVIDPETGELVRKYRNLQFVDAPTREDSSPDEMDKEKKEMNLGSQSGKDKDNQVEVILMYYITPSTAKVVEIANRRTVIRSVDTPYQQDERQQDVEVVGPEGPTKAKKTIDKILPFYPFAILRNVIDSSLFFGTGDVEVILDRQETLNDVENLDLDNLHYMNNVMWRIDPAYEDMAGEIESTPGIVIPIPRFGLEPIPKPIITGDLDAKKAEIKDEMRKATAADEIMQGSQSSSRTTATEIQQVATQSNQRFQSKITNLESEGYAQLASVLFKVSQIMVDQKTVVRIVGPEGVAFKDFDPNEFSGFYEPHVKLDSTIKLAKQERGLKDNQLYQLILNNPVVNQQEAIRMIAKSLDASDEDINRLLTLPPPPPAPPVPAAPAAPEADVDPEAESASAVQQAREDFANANGAGPDEDMDPDAESALAIRQAREDFAAQGQ